LQQEYPQKLLEKEQVIEVDKMTDSKCPLCNEVDSFFKIKYPGIFINCIELHQCQECDLIYCIDLPTKEELNSYYSNGGFYDEFFNPFSKEFLNFSVKLSKSRLRLIEKKTHVFMNNCKVLDIGSGNSSFGIALKKFSQEFIYDVVEPDDQVRSKLIDWTDNRYSDIEEIRAGEYNLALMNQVLEHVPDPVNFIASVSPLLRKSGYLFIDVPYKDFLYKPSVAPHILFWTQESISYLLEKAGFQIIFCNTAGMPYNKAKKFFNPKTLMEKICNPWLYANYVNKIAANLVFPDFFDTFSQFESDQYGGDRQWLRCLAQKID
jgi:2-polyprenyl-3-methyl-5-hydroxy-6-metoxy-1,4-benzoquinol methylase